MLSDIKNIEFNLMTNLYIHLLIFCKNEMDLTGYQIAVLINICHLVAGFDKFEEGSKGFKSIRDRRHDESFFKKILEMHSHKGETSLKVYKFEESRKIYEMSKRVYFDHYNLYNYILNNQQKTKDMQILVFVDTPEMIPPLSNTNFLGETIPVQKDLDDEIVPYLFLT